MRPCFNFTLNMLKVAELLSLKKDFCEVRARIAHSLLGEALRHVRFCKIRAGVILGLLFLPTLALANIEITEIMYDLEGTDTGREWIEVWNKGNEDVDITDWKFYEAEVNHKINSATPGVAEFEILGGGFAIIADNPEKFLIDHSSFSGTVFDSSFSLKNTGETIAIRNSELVDIDSIFYNPELGADGDGNSLQKVGGVWMAGSPTPGVQCESCDDSNLEAELPSGSFRSETPASLSSQDESYIPPENRPKIGAYAGEDKITVVGVLTEFRGKAEGLEGGVLENARYLWNFGDGSLKEGQNISHSYRFVGEYAVYLSVSSGEYSSSDTLVIRVVPSEIFISEVKTGIDSFIELENKSKHEINVSGWRFRSGLQTFTFAKNSFIRPHSYLVISITSSGILLASGKGMVELLYPGGFLADSFEYNGVLKEGESFARKENGSVITLETPGKKNDDVNLLKSDFPRKTDFDVLKSVEVESSTIEVQPPYINVDETDQLEEVEPLGANVVAITNKESSNKSLYYFLGVLGLVLFASLGVLMVRRNRSA